MERSGTHLGGGGGRRPPSAWNGAKSGHSVFPKGRIWEYGTLYGPKYAQFWFVGFPYLTPPTRISGAFMPGASNGNFNCGFQWRLLGRAGARRSSVRGRAVRARARAPRAPSGTAARARARGCAARAGRRLRAQRSGTPHAPGLSRARGRRNAGRAAWFRRRRRQARRVAGRGSACGRACREAPSPTRQVVARRNEEEQTEPGNLVRGRERTKLATCFN